MNARLPLIVILGATGSGKTKLSLELAQRFGGEIIGADSMQIYKRLDVITAKATVEERALAPHHLIDVLHPHQMFTVVEFRDRALQTIDEIFSKNKIPIIVGGTNYYIESLLFKILVEEPGKAKPFEPGISSNNEHMFSSGELHKKLLQCDPIRAKQLHPNNKRKILRSLEVFYQKGRRHSDILQEQQSSEGGSSLGGGLRFSNAVILWLQCQQNVLDKRLDDRVDSMLEQGLIDELLDFHKKYNEKRINKSEEVDYTKGIFQSIGFKEFHKYLVLNSTDRASEDGERCFKEGVDNLKMATRRYARKQKRWVTNRFLSNLNRNLPPVYGLDTTDVSAWDVCVTTPAIKIIESFMVRSSCAYKALPLQAKQSFPNSQACTHFCEVCDRVFVGKDQWDAHVKSHRHRKVLERKKKMQKDAKCDS